jgi:Escherichia/Staphylococcus phage prohead protease
MRPVVYGQPAWIGLPDGHGFRETIAAGALTPALARRDDVVALRDHDSGKLLGRTASKTLALRHLPSVGLEAVVDVPNTQLGAETVELVGRGDLAGCSFAFRVGKDSWYEDDDGMPSRVIETLTGLADVSVCTWPSYEATSVWIRSETSASSEQADDEWMAAAEGRRRRLQLLTIDDEVPESRARWGKRMAPPSWWKPPRLNTWRHGCGHVLGGEKLLGVS